MPHRKSFSKSNIADVAREASVSTATVSRVLNSNPLVAEETRQRVYAAIDALGYRPHAAARGLANRQTQLIGLLLPEISGDFFPPLLRGIEAVARAAGYSLIIHSTGGRPDQRDDRPLGEHNTDGLLVFTDSLTDEAIERLHAHSFPMVLLHRTPPDNLSIPCVTIENKAGARRLIDHLVEVHGYRHIAFLKGPPDNEDSYWREMGYREALINHGIEIDPQLIGYGGFEEADGFNTTAAWLVQGISPDAIFAGDDEAALGALSAIQQRGLRVPEDIALVGFDDVPISSYLNPPLTTVRAPIETIGQEAARQLIALIRKEEAQALTLLPTELSIRRSCGCV
jgi:LacI family transcriptional regulator